MKIKNAIVVVSAFVAAVLAAENGNSPVGRWQIISDVTGQPNGVIEISEQNGELTGRLRQTAKPEFMNQPCDKCPGDRRGKPMAGLVILSGIHRHGDEWTGGEILDPDTGKVYRVKLRVVEGGTALQVRGYVGVSLLGRTQVWRRLAE